MEYIYAFFLGILIGIILAVVGFGIQDVEWWLIMIPANIVVGNLLDPRKK